MPRCGAGALLRAQRNAWRGILLGSFLLLVCATRVQSQTVWEIGRADRSAREFSAEPRPNLVYVPGKSDWHSDWAGTQNCGSQYFVDFTLPGTAAGHYVLHASVLAASRMLPALRVQVNGRAGTFYLEPTLRRSDAEPDPVAVSELSVDVPDGYLHNGENRIGLGCVALGAAPSAPRESLAIRYDALSLEREAGPGTHNITARLTPTIFYREQAGQLYEVVNALVRFAEPFEGSTAVLSINGRQLSATLERQEEFGEQSINFEVPEWNGAVSAQLTIQAPQRTSFSFQIEAARKWKLFVVPHTHLDIGYTDFQGKVAEVQAQTLLDAMAMIEKHPDFRFATDGSWNVEQFMETRSPALQSKLMELVKADKIGIPAEYANLLTGYASLETLYRSLYYTRSLSHRFGIPFDYATVTDVPSYTGAYPSILASAGIRYLAVGGNGDRGPVLQHEQWNARSPFWWQGSDGKKVLFWYARGYSQIESIFGLPPQADAGRDALPLFLSPYNRAEYKPDAVLVYGAQSENTQLEPALAGFAAEWNSRYAYPKIQYSTFIDFFHYIDERYGASLATYKGDMGPYWEDGVASDAVHTSQDRTNQNRALSVEIASTAAHELGLGYHPPKVVLDDAWKNITLYSEHTWTGGMSVTQPHMDRVIGELAVKDQYSTEAKFRLDDVAERSMGVIADQIHAPALTLVVFNGLNWKRNVLIETDLRKNESLVDMTTGKPIPVEVLWRREGFTRARAVVPDVPGIGYKCIQFKVGATDVPIDREISMDTTVENAFYRIVVDPQTGSIRSIFDKQLQRELVDQKSAYRFGQYVYVTGGDGATRIIHSDPGLPVPALDFHLSQGGKYLGAEKTPWGTVIRLASSAVNTRSVQLEILLFNNEKKMEFNYSVDKQFTYAKEGVYIAFPVATATPQFAYEIQQGWVDPAKDLLKGGSAEWFTVQHWMAAYDAGLAVGIVPVDAPLATFGDVVRGTWPGEFHAKSSTIFSYVMNNYWHTNYQAGQDGVLKFRYVLTSADHLRPAALTRLGWESMEPVELNRVIVPDKIGNPDRPLPAEGASFLEASGEDVVLSDWKLAEDGKGTIVRLAETGGHASEATIHVPRHVLQQAVLCNAVEDDQKAVRVENNSVRIELHPYEVVTVRLQTANAQ